MSYDNRGFNEWSERESYLSHLDEKYGEYCDQVRTDNLHVVRADEYESVLPYDKWLHDVYIPAREQENASDYY